MNKTASQLCCALIPPTAPPVTVQRVLHEQGTSITAHVDECTSDLQKRLSSLASSLQNPAVTPKSAQSPPSMHGPSSSLPSARQSDRSGTNKYLVQHREILSPEAQTGEGPV